MKPNIRYRLTQRRSGLVLLIVTIVLVLIGLGAMGFVELMQIEHQATKMRGDELVLENVSSSASDYLVALTSSSRKQRDELGGLGSNPDLFKHQSVTFNPEQPAESHFAVVSALTFPSPSIAFGATNESAKIHLQSLLDWDRKFPGQAQRSLLQLPGMTIELADKLLDWLDPDSNPRMFGAEQDTYANLRSGIEARNAVPEFMDELLEIPGITRELLYGHDSDSGELSGSKANEQQARSGGSTNNGPGWAQFITVYSNERNSTYDDSPRIYLNRPDLVSLHHELDIRLGRDWADLVVAFRQFGSHHGRSGPVASNYRVDLTLPARFEFGSELDLIGLKVGIPADNGSVRLLVSPFKVESNRMGQKLEPIFDLLTIDERTVVPGRINVNEASREVFLGIPKMDPVTADRILVTRSSRLPNVVIHIHPIWLLEQGVVELGQMKQLLPYITTGGDVWQANVVSYFADRPMFLWDEIVVNGTGQGMSRLYCKDQRDRRLPIPVGAVFLSTW